MQDVGMTPKMPKKNMCRRVIRYAKKKEVVKEAKNQENVRKMKWLII